MTREETNIDQLMLDKGIRRDNELADLMELSASGLHNRLKGNISTKTLEDLSKIFDVTIKELIK